MVFSLFGKKPQPAPAKPAAKKAPARPAAPPPAPSHTPAATPEPASTPAPRQPESVKELESLDFTAPGAIEVREDHEANIEIRESSALTHPVVEEAAILFANGQDEAALASLETAVGAGSLGVASDQVWAMLFDLYQLMDQREAFERRALEYSVKFEKSPPTWVEPTRQPLNPALSTGGQAYVAFAGLLGEAADKQVQQLEKLVSGGPMVRVEFGKVLDVDMHGAAMLLKAMKAARKAKCELIMTAAPQFAKLLAGKIETGRRENEDLWLLLLELYQQMGDQEPFEEWALNYAITFEVSPPSWENRPAPRKAAPAAEPRKQAEPDVFALTGEMSGAGSDAFQHLNDFAASHDQIVIDCATLKRMDFVSAGMFLNTLSNLAANGKTVQIGAANQLLYGLFSVLGITQVAQVERRKF